jgi:hypothetical protein
MTLKSLNVRNMFLIKRADCLKGQKYFQSQEPVSSIEYRLRAGVTTQIRNGGMRLVL